MDQVIRTSSEAKALAIRDVETTFPTPDGKDELAVLRGVSLDVGTGELVAISGRSGSGKTTLLRVAAGLRKPDRGVVEWDGVSIEGLTRAEVGERRRALIGFVFQSGGLLEQLTAAENVALGSMPTGVRADGRKRAVDLLEQVGLADRAGHFPSQLSGGERQRVALARALFSNPRILLVDEPTANLDRRSGDGIIELLAGLRSSSRALLVASHDDHLVVQADRVLPLD